MVQSGVRLFTGVNFSNVLAAVAPAVLNAGGFYVSLNAAPSNYAGRACNPIISRWRSRTTPTPTPPAWPPTTWAPGAWSSWRLTTRPGATPWPVSSAPGGEIVEEIYTKLDQSDFSVELARIRSLDPDALFQFHPGGAGINLTKQFANSGWPARSR